jgi:archaeal chaperonin
MAKLAKATGARIVTNTDELSKDDIGHSDLIEERKVETDKWVFIEGLQEPQIDYHPDTWWLPESCR